jgi:hypothetical protein
MIILVTCLILIGKRDGPLDAAVPTLPPHTYIIVLRNSKKNYWRARITSKLKNQRADDR